MPRMLFRAGLILSAVCRLWAGPCTQTTLDVYIALPPTGCTIGTNSFEQFSFSVLTQSGTIPPTPVAPNQITVTPTQIGGQNGLSFSSNSFVVTNDQLVRYLLTFAEDPTGSIISLDDALFDPVTSPGRAQVDSMGCLGGTFTGFNTCSTGAGNIVGPVTVFDDGLNPVRFAALGIAGQTLLGIQDVILTNGGGAGGSVEPPFTVGTQFVPEPGEGWLAAGGLGVLLLARQLRLKRAQVRLH